ncbi:hypothetical protein [Argonema antarcticum]|uniref:hypothetical protein n=1 Tax=Argonema antarcticum TaxID=2942763 RepID=UPI0020129325|nr:hypothetical protein [Argonema antarcticum]MCL1473333.1 hypothetical protein [Argonema antarcticum A004/B2]
MPVNNVQLSFLGSLESIMLLWTRHYRIMSIVQNFYYAVSLQKCSQWNISIIIPKDPSEI